jgi:glycosidase
MKKMLRAVWVGGLIGVLSVQAQPDPEWVSGPYGLQSRVGEPGFSFRPSPADWRDVNMYQIFTDRFASSGENIGYIESKGWYVGSRTDSEGRNFHHGGDWEGLRQNIPYLKGMGVTAIWMSGVQMNDQGTDNRFTPYHMYHPTDFFKVDPALGTFEDLTTLIDELHANGIYVILDVVINHTADLNGLWGNDRNDDKGYWAGGNSTHDWWDSRRHAPPFDDLQWFHNNGTINCWDCFPESLLGQFKGTDDLRTETEHVTYWLTEAFKHLIDATDCDGFRVDAIKHVEFDWVMKWADDIRKHAATRGKNDFILFGEYFSYDHGALASYCRDPNYAFNSALFFPMSQTFKSVFVDGGGTGQLTQQLNNRAQYGEGADRLVTFIDNHDVNRIGLQAGADVGRIEYIMPPALTFLYTATPVPCLFYGTEHAFQQGGHWNGSNAGADYDDADWQRETMFNKGFQPGPAFGNKLAATNAPLYQHIAALNRARADHISLRRGGFQERWQSGSRGPYAFSRVYDDEEALVAFNTADNNQTINPQVGKPEGTSFYNTLNPSETVTVGSDGRISFDLAPQQTKIFVAGTAALQLWIRSASNFPLDGDATSDDTLYFNVEAGPAGAVTNVLFVYSTDNGSTWTEQAMAVNADWSSQAGDWYSTSLFPQPAGTSFRYFMTAQGEEGAQAWDSNNSQDYSLTIAQGGGSELWIRNTRNFPADGDATTADSIYIDTEVGPSANAPTVTVYTVIAGETNAVPMTKNTSWGSDGGDWYNADLGTFAEDTTIRYYIEATDGEVTRVSDNGGSLFSLTVRGAPLAITSPGSDLAINFAQSNVTLSGTAEVDVQGPLFWTNALTGASGQVDLTNVWTIADVALGVGVNEITVYAAKPGSGTGGVVAEDRAENYASLADGSNGGTGFGAWSFNHNQGSGSAGVFTGDPAAAEMTGFDTVAFGFYANPYGSFANAEIARDFSSPMEAGMVLSFDLGINWDSFYGESYRGFSLLAGSTELLYINASTGNVISIDGQPLFANYGANAMPLAFEYVEDGSIRVTGTGRDGSESYDQTLTVPAGAPSRIKFYYNATDADEDRRQMYFDNLSITDPAAGIGQVSAVITIERAEQDALDSNADGVPDWWYERYELDPQQVGLGEERSPSGYSYWAAYVMNLDPTDTGLPAFEVRLSTQGLTFMAPGEGRRYVMQFTPSLLMPFEDISGALTVGDHMAMNALSNGYYRLRYLNDNPPGPTGVVESVTVSATPGNSSYTNAAGVSVRLSVSGVNVVSSEYSINLGARQAFRNSDQITLGAGATNDQVTTLTLYGETANGTQATRTYGYTFRDTSVTPTLEEVAGTHHWVSEANQVFINAAGYPEGSTVEAYIIYSVNPDPADTNAWPLVAMNRLTDWENGDWWNNDLGILEDGDEVQFAIMMKDAQGNEVWDNNGGSNYAITIGDNGGPVTPGGNEPYSTNPTVGKRDTMTIDGSPAGWTDAHLIALDKANDDPRSLGSNWTMHEPPIDATHLWAAWDDNNLYLAWQFVDVTDVLDPANAGGAGSGKIGSNDGILQWIVIDTDPNTGSTSDMWEKLISWTGPNKPNYQLYLAGSLWQGFISRAVDGVFPVDDDGTNYNSLEAAGIQVAKGDTFGGTSLLGVGDADERNSGGTLRNFLDEGHDTTRDSFYEISIPLSYLGITAATLDATGIGGVMIGAGSDSAMDSIPHDETTMDTPGVEVYNSSFEWGDVDIFTSPFARIGGSLAP